MVGKTERIINENKHRPKMRVEFDKIEENPVKKREQMKNAILSFNESFHFGPAREAIQYTSDAKLANRGLSNAAIEKFSEAYQLFKHPVLLLNEAKCRLEAGDPSGLFLLIVYQQENDPKYDYFSNKILQELRFEIDTESRICTGSLQDQSFYITEETEDENSFQNLYFDDEEYRPITLDIPFRMPYSLTLERKDRDIIKYVDYYYIYEWYNPNSSRTVLELRVPLLIWRSFLQDFSGTIYELCQDRYCTLNDLEDIFFEELQHLYVPLDDKIEQYQKELIFSMLKVEIKPHKVGDLINLFREQIRDVLPEELSKEEIAILDFEERQQENPTNDPVYLEQFEKENERYEYDLYFSGDEQKYAVVCGVLYNIENGRANPFLSIENKGYHEGRKYYQAFFPAFFPNVAKETNNETLEQRLLNLIEHVQNKGVREKLRDRIEQIFLVLPSSPSSIAQHIRTALEGILYGIYFEIMNKDIPDNDYLMRVTDDGVGFDLNDATKMNSYGLQSMRERAMEIGGQFRMVSLKNQGTQLEVKVPLMKREVGFND